MKGKKVKERIEVVKELEQNIYLVKVLGVMKLEFGFLLFKFVEKIKVKVFIFSKVEM